MNRGEESIDRRAVVEAMDTEVRSEESGNLRAGERRPELLYYW